MGTTKIMVIRHAEKPGTYNGQSYNGVDIPGTVCGVGGASCLVTIGWQRAGALVTLFAPPWGPRLPTLAQPKYIYAADPARNGGKIPSQRPHNTVLGVAGQLGITINTMFKKGDHDKLAKDALRQDGAVLICWRQEEIPLIAQCLLSETDTTAALGVPTTWPTGANGGRYDLVWVFDRPSGNGPVTGFSQFAQMLLAGDEAAPAPSSPPAV